MARSPSYVPFDRDRLPPGIEPVADTDPSILGPYMLVGRIGAGGMGAVYAGIAEDGRHSALKVVHPHFASDPEFLARFGREVDLVARVDAACTPDFHGADLSAETPWLATEYVPGPTLRGHVREKGALSGGMLMAVAVGLAEALQAIHSAGVVHRDLKPGNVIMSPQGPKVLDFGIARALEGTTLTSTGGIIGTPGWMAPEQYEGTEASPSSDMFSWAALVYFAATGREPFGRGAVDVVSHRTRNETPALAGVPEEVLGLVRAGLGRDPGQRPTAAQALEELTGRWSRTQVGAGAQEPAQDAPVVIAAEWSGVDVPEPRKVRRSRRGLLLLLAAASVLVLGLLGSWIFLVPSTDGPDGGASVEEDEGLAVETDPEDPAAVAQEAVELARGAESFESAYFMTGTELGDPPWQEFTYTEDPEPVYWQSDMGGPALSEIIEIGEGPDEVIRNSRMRNEGVEDAFYRDPADEAYDSRRELWEDWLGRVTEVVEQAQEVTYGGATEVGVAEGISEDERVDEGLGGSVSGHHYTGSLPSSIEEGESDAHFFHLWIGEDGYPQLLLIHEEWTVDSGQDAVDNHVDEFILFEQFGEPVAVDLPDETEVGDGPPNTGT